MKNIFLFLLLFLSACSGEKNTKQAQSSEETEVVANEDQSARELVSFERPGINLSNSLLADYQRAKKKHKYLPFCTATQDGNLFISCNRKFSIDDMNSPKWNKSILFGLTSGKGDTLLPNVFEKIGNPGIYGDGYIEVFKKGKYQLYDYINRRLLTEEFELIFPSMIKGYLAIGKRNGQFFKLYDDGTSRLIENENEYPSYNKIAERLKFDVQSDSFGLWYNTELFDAEFKEDVYAGVYTTPSYLYALGIIEKFVVGVAFENNSIGIAQFKALKVEQKKRNSKVRSMAIAFMEEGIDARGWVREEHELITLDEKSKVKFKKKLNSFSDYSMQNKCHDCGGNGFKFINDSIIEVESWLFPSGEFSEDRNNVKPGFDSLFVAMSHYTYYSIEADGKIKELHAGSLFPMASVVPITKDYLKGCFLKNNKQFPDIMSYPPIENFADYEEDSPSAWLIELNQLSAKDIRFMINEIYARHGYIFGDKQLNNYFRSLKWYKPRNRKVDQLLTPLEKQNIYFLQTIEKQLKQNEREQLQAKRRVLVWAG